MADLSNIISLDVGGRGPLGHPNFQVRLQLGPLARAIADAQVDFIKETLGVKTVFVAKALQSGEFLHARERFSTRCAEAGRDGALAGLEANHQTNGPGPYRVGASNRLSGHLQRAILNPRFVRADQNGFSYMNKQLLNREAAHWARLHFGAGTRGSSTPAAAEVQVTLSLGGRQVHLPDMKIEGQVRPGFSMPAGYFRQGGESGAIIGANSGRRGLDAFYPGRSGPDKGGGTRTGKMPTKGIVGSRFLDEGLRRIAAVLPAASEDLGADFVEAVTDPFERGEGVQYVRI
jgi:hypothetical protein